MSGGVDLPRFERAILEVSAGDDESNKGWSCTTGIAEGKDGRKRAKGNKDSVTNLLPLLPDMSKKGVFRWQAQGTILRSLVSS